MNVSAFGTKVQLTASVTFPQGITITQFADDADGLDIPSIQIGDAAKGTNGDLVAWSKAAVENVTLNVIPGGENDKDLMTLYNANKATVGKTPARDEIKLVITHPDGTVDTKEGGTVTDYIPGMPFASSGRNKTKPYAFKF
jgi:hypothetical protein